MVAGCASGSQPPSDGNNLVPRISFEEERGSEYRNRFALMIEVVILYVIQNGRRNQINTGITRLKSSTKSGCRSIFMNVVEQMDTALLMRIEPQSREVPNRKSGSAD